MQILVPITATSQNIKILQIQYGGRPPYWKSFFWLYLGAILADQREVWNRNEAWHADIGHVTKNAIFANSGWRTAAILKIALSLYLSRKLSDFNEIWCVDADCVSKVGYLTKYQIFFKFKMADGRHIENRLLAISWRMINSPVARTNFFSKPCNIC